MAPQASPWFWAALFLSIVAPLVFLALLRRVERYGRESLLAVAASFALGAAVAFPLSLWAERTFVTQSGLASARDLNLVVFAPVVEECIKAACAAAFWKKFTEPADGAVYGAGVGFGFAAIENAGYALRAAIESDAWAALMMALNRVVSASVAHAVLTGFVGFSLAMRRTQKTSGVWIAISLLAVILVHSAYNRFSIAIDQNEVSAWAGLPLAIVFWALVPIGAYGLRRLDGRIRHTGASRQRSL